MAQSEIGTLLEKEALCRVLRRLLSSEKGTLVSTLINELKLPNEVIANSLKALESVALISGPDSFGRVKFVATGETKQVVLDFIHKYEFSQVKERALKLKYNAAGRISAIDSLAEAIFHARKSLAR